MKTDPAGRDPEKVQMVVIKQGYEPPQFTGHFQAWNDDVFAVSSNKSALTKMLIFSFFLKNSDLQSDPFNIASGPCFS